MQFAYKFSPKKRAILGKFTSKMKFAKKFLTPLGKFLEIPLGAGFLTLEMVKMTLSEGQILIIEVIYQPFELKIHKKVRLLMPKIMPEQLLNISKKKFINPRKRVF